MNQHQRNKMELESVNFIFRCYLVTKKKNRHVFIGKRQSRLIFELFDLQAKNAKQRMHHIISITKSMSCNYGHVIRLKRNAFPSKYPEMLDRET